MLEAALMLAVLGALVIYLLVHYDVFGPSSGSRTSGSGNAAGETRSVAHFTGIELVGSNNVVIRLGRPQSVIVHGDDNLIGSVTTVVQDGRLLIGNTLGTFTARAPMFVAVTAPTLDAVVLSGSGNVAVRGVVAPKLTVELSGSGNLRAAGRVTTLTLTVSGSGTADFRQLIARDARATVSGSGAISLTATGSLDARVPGSGVIAYAGNPARVRESVTGSGAVNRSP